MISLDCICIISETIYSHPNWRCRNNNNVCIDNVIMMEQFGTYSETETIHDNEALYVHVND